MSKRTVFRIVGVVAAVMAVLVTGGEVWANLAQTPVRATTRFEEDPAVAGSYLAWDQNSAGRPNHFNVFVRHGTTITQVNPARTYGWGPSMDGTTIAYQQVSLKGQADIRMYDVVTHLHSAPPAGVNTPAYEWSPEISGNWLLFGRASGPTRRHTQVILRNLTNKTSFVLADVNSPTIHVYPGDISGNWAVWGVDGPKISSVLRRDIAAKKSTKLVNTLPPARFEYNPSVAADGTAYYAHSGSACGDHVKLVKQAPGQPETVINTFSSGIDYVDADVVPDPTSGTDIYFTKYYCKRQTADIYKMIDP